MLNKECQAGTEAQQRTNDEVTTSSHTIGKPNVICSQSIQIGLLNRFRFFSFFKELKHSLISNRYKRRGIKIIYSSPLAHFNKHFEYSSKQYLRICQKGLKQRLFQILGLKKLF